MDELVVIFIGVFISNYEPKKHPYFTSIIKAFLIALLGFLFWTTKDFINHILTFERIKFGLFLAAILWLFLSCCFCVIEFFYKKDE